MKISEVLLHPVATRRHTGLLSYHVIVELRTAGGAVGWGEMSDLGHLPLYMPDLPDLQRTLNQLLAGEDARRISLLNARMLQAFPEQMYVYDMGAVIRCGVDMALHDVVARSLEVPASTLLGGRCRDRFPVCYPIFRITTEAQIEQNLQTVRERIAEGYNAFRLYVGRRPDLDERFCDAFRKEHGDRVILKSLDFSNILPWKEALAVTRRLLPYGPLLVESPALRHDYEGFAEFRRACPLPVSEHAYSRVHVMEMIRHRSIDILNVALVFIGGFEAALGMMRVAQAAELPCLIGTTQELSLGTAGQAQLGAVAPNLEYISDCSGPRLYADDVCSDRVRYEDSHVVVPEGPGLGLAPDPDLLASLKSPLRAPSESAISANLDRTTVVDTSTPSSRYGG
ncbi:MAG: galactonate dehydratase [Fimbriimonadales bacterium]